MCDWEGMSAGTSREGRETRSSFVNTLCGAAKSGASWLGGGTSYCVFEASMSGFEAIVIRCRFLSCATLHRLLEWIPVVIYVPLHIPPPLWILIFSYLVGFSLSLFYVYLAFKCRLLIFCYRFVFHLFPVYVCSLLFFLSPCLPSITSASINVT